MASVDRRQRARDEVRRVLLGAAWDLFSTFPAEEVTIRGIAEKAEYSSRTLYLYFRDKEDLLGAVVEEAFRRTLDSMAGTTSEVLRRLIVRHVTEALTRPILYETIFHYLWSASASRGPHRRAVEDQICVLLTERGATPESATLMPVLLRSFTMTLIREEIPLVGPEVVRRTGEFSDLLFRGMGIEVP